MKTGIIYSVGLYQRGLVVIQGGRKRKLTWKRLRPVGEGGGTPVRHTDAIAILFIVSAQITKLRQPLQFLDV